MRLSRAALTAAVVLALAAAPLSSATAAPDDPPDGPTRADVRAARQVAATRADQVGQIQAQLARAQQRLQRVQVASMQATEAYNGAVYRLQQARKDAAAASRHAARADREVERQRRALEGFAVGTSSDATSLADLDTVLSAGGPEELLEDYGAWSDTTSALQSDLDDWDAARAVADVLREQADAARALRADAAQAARDARDAAQAAAAAAAQQEAAISARTDRLVRALAHAQQVSVRLATERQLAVAAAAAQAAQQAAEAAAADDATDDATGDATGDADGGTAQPPVDHGATGGATELPPTPAPSPTPPPSSGGAAAAIAFARAQLGEPYVYGADGPDSWDCSGLTSQAWAAAGHPLSHWSVAQYAETTPISVSQLQPGDLAFWSNGSPGSIYHVAMYIGDGLIIQAPRPGRGVEIVSMYYWIAPDLFGRV